MLKLNERKGVNLIPHWVLNCILGYVNTTVNKKDKVASPMWLIL